MRIEVKQKDGELESWLHQLQEQVSELKPDNEEVQAKLKELQINLEQAIRNQAKQQQQQTNCQKQITLLRSQIEEANEAKTIQPLQEKIQQLESELTLLKTKSAETEIATQLKAVQKELLNFKKSSEQVAKINSSLRSQLQGVIETSDKQAQQVASWQEELTLRTHQQEELLNELQVQLSQTKAAFSKRLAALEGRVSDLGDEVKGLSSKVKSQDPEFTVVQKLLKLRQAVLEDKFISDELKYYVAPNGEDQPGLGDHEALCEWTQANFLDAKAEARVLLLQGQAGAGKSTFNRFLLRHLWQDKAWETFKPGEKAPFVPVPIFVPLGSQQVNPTALLKYLTDLPELTEDFTDAEINVLKRDYRLLLIADGYDEMPGRQALNLYDVNQFDQYQGRFKLLIGCRTQRAQELDETTLFVPHDRDGKPQYYEFKRRHVSPFNDTQIRDYLTKYLAENKDRTDITLWKEVKEYEAEFARLPELKALITTPFLLLMVIEILPTRMAETAIAESKESKTVIPQKLTRAKLYDCFIDSWCKRQAEKARKAGDTTPPKLLMQQYRQFCLKFAERLHAAGITSVQYPFGEEDLFGGDLLSDKPKKMEDPQSPRGPWVKKLLGTENETMLRARKSAPLLIGTDNYYQFIHASLIDYFLTTAIADQARSENTTSQKHKIEPKPVILSDAESNSTDDLLCRGPLTKDQISLLADRLEEDTQLKGIFFQFIERSKKEPALAQAAANAITVLNAARVTFSGMDFKGIRIPGANLSQAVLDCTQLQGADLRKVNLTGAWLRQTNFSKSQMSGTQWGKWPSLILPGPATACAYSPDGRWLAVGCYDSNIYLYHAENRKLQHVLQGHKDRISSLAFDSRNKRLASGSDDKTIRLWQVPVGRLERTLEGHTTRVKSVAFDPKGERLASSSERWDYTIRLWQVETGKLERILEGHKDMVTSVAFDPRSERLASGSVDKSICLWQIATGKLERTLEWQGKRSEEVSSIAFDARGERLASGNGDYSGNDDNTICLWQVATGKLERIFKGHTKGVLSVAFDPRGERLASGSWDNTVRLWQVATGKLERTLEGHTVWVNGVAFDPRGERLVSASQDQTVCVWQVSSSQLEQTREGHTDLVTSVAFDARGERLASGSHDRTIRLWQVRTGRLERTLEEGLGEVLSIAFDAKGERLASALGWGKKIRLWEVATGKLERTLEEEFMLEVKSVAFDARGERLASGNGLGIVHLWQVSTGKLERTLSPPINGGEVWSIAFDPLGERLSAGMGGWGWKPAIYLWQVTTGELERKLEVKGNVTKVAFDPQGERLAASSDKTICLWRASTGKLERTLETGYVISFAFDARGERLASGMGDNTVRFWQISTGACLGVIQGFFGCVGSVSWQTTPLGTFLATGGADKAVRCWQVEEDKATKDKVRVTLRWTSHQAVLTAVDACIEDAIGLDETARDLLLQHGAKGKPQKDSTVIRGLSALAARFGLLAAPAASASASASSTKSLVLESNTVSR